MRAFVSTCLICACLDVLVPGSPSARCARLVLLTALRSSRFIWDNKKILDKVTINGCSDVGYRIYRKLPLIAQFYAPGRRGYPLAQSSLHKRSIAHAATSQETFRISMRETCFRDPIVSNPTSDDLPHFLRYQFEHIFILFSNAHGAVSAIRRNLPCIDKERRKNLISRILITINVALCLYLTAY
jgi:hypothetical protein